jgi:lysophospholipase L1-like esterase
LNPRLRSAALNLALAAGAVAVCLLLAEGAARLMARSARGGKEQLERSRYTEYDPVLGWRKTPGAQVVYDRREYHVEYRVNSRGLRGPERAYAKTPGVPRVLALGDSFVEAFMADDPSTITSRLEAHLGGRGCGAEVINGGTVGYSTDQEYLFYRDEGRKYAPDVVVLFVYHNDIPWLVRDHYLTYPKPRLDFTTDPPVVSNEPVPPYVPPPAAAPPASPDDRPTSYLLEFVKQRLERGSARTYNRLAGLGLWEPLRKLPMNEELQMYRVPELGHLRPAWSAFTWTVQTLAKATTGAGARLVVAYVPSRMEVRPQVWAFTQERYEIDETFQRGAVASRLHYIAGRLGVPMLDLTEPLARADSLLVPTYYQTDSHWNPHGQDVAAQALAEFLAARGLVPGCRGDERIGI